MTKRIRTGLEVRFAIKERLRLVGSVTPEKLYRYHEGLGLSDAHLGKEFNLSPNIIRNVRVACFGELYRHPKPPKPTPRPVPEVVQPGYVRGTPMLTEIRIAQLFDAVNELRVEWGFKEVKMAERVEDMTALGGRLG